MQSNAQRTSNVNLQAFDRLCLTRVQRRALGRCVQGVVELHVSTIPHYLRVVNESLVDEEETSDKG